MAKDPKPIEVLNAQAKQAVNETKQATDRMKQAVEETKGQALGAADKLSAIGKQPMAHAYSAMDYYFDHLKKTVASAPSGGTEFGEKVKAYAEKNIAATQEFVRDLSYAKDVQDMFRIQMEFMRAQLEAFGEQANSLGEAYIKAASGQMRKPSP
jgi:hypothetical protein